MAIEYSQKYPGKIIRKRFTLEQLEPAIMDATTGFCVACGEETTGVEPDAERYECEVCGLNHVYGAQEILLRGWVNQ